MAGNARAVSRSGRKRSLEVDLSPQAHDGSLDGQDDSLSGPNSPLNGHDGHPSLFDSVPPEISDSLAKMEELISASVLPSNFGSEDHVADDADTSDLRRQSDAFSLSVAALDWIHRKRLWTQRAASFGEYARVRWNVTRQRLYQIIKCKAILDVTHGEVKPYSTALCVEIGRIRQQHGALADQVWQLAVARHEAEGKRISVNTLKALADDLLRAPSGGYLSGSQGSRTPSRPSSTRPQQQRRPGSAGSPAPAMPAPASRGVAANGAGSSAHDGLSHPTDDSVAALLANGGLGMLAGAIKGYASASAPQALAATSTHPVAHATNGTWRTADPTNQLALGTMLPFTPALPHAAHPEILERARSALGGAIDLNVLASNQAAENDAVRARNYYLGYLGLSHSWHGTVWGNLVCRPDGGSGSRLSIEEEDTIVGSYLTAATLKLHMGEYVQAIMLLPCRPTAPWWKFVVAMPHVHLTVHPFWPTLPTPGASFTAVHLSRGTPQAVMQFCQYFHDIGYIAGVNSWAFRPAAA